MFLKLILGSMLISSTAAANCGFVENDSFDGLTDDGKSCTVVTKEGRRTIDGGGQSSICFAEVSVDGRTFDVLASVSTGPKFYTRNFRGQARRSDGLVYDQEQGLATIVDANGQIVKSCGI